MANEIMGRNLDAKQIGALIESMNTELVAAEKVAEELSVDQKTLMAMDYSDVKRFEQELSAALKKTDEARKEFKRQWQAPMKSVEEAFKAETERITDLHLMYKGERITRDSKRDNERMDILAGYYIDFCESNGVSLYENVPFERIFEKSWLNGGKNWSESKQGAAVEEKAAKIISDWNALKAAQLFYRDEAEIEFFKTLDFPHVIEHDQQVKAERDRLEAMHKQERENVTYREQPPVEAVPMDFQEVGVYVFSVEATQEQVEAVLSVFKANGIHGNKVRTRFTDWRECHMEVKQHVC